MASGHGQACMITSFFKSPPKDEDTEPECSDQSDQAVAAGQGDIACSETAVPSSGPDQLDSSSSQDSDSDDCPGRPQGKSLVVNLCGLLSPEVMETSRPLRRLSLKKRNRELRKEKQHSFTDYPQVLPNGSGAAPPPSNSVLRDAASYTTGCGSCQGTPYTHTTGLSNQFTNGTKSVCSQRRDSPDLRPLTGGVMSALTSTDSQSVVSKRKETTTCPVTMTTDTPVSLRQSTLTWNCQSGLHVVRPPTDLPSIQQHEDKQQLNGGKQQHEDKQQQQCKQREKETSAVAEQECVGKVASQKNNSFEDFEEGRRVHPRKLRLSKKTSKNEEKMEEVSPPPASCTSGGGMAHEEPIAKRPRRAAALDAQRKSLQLPRRRSRRLKSSPSPVGEEEREGRGEEEERQPRAKSDSLEQASPSAAKETDSSQQLKREQPVEAENKSDHLPDQLCGVNPNPGLLAVDSDDSNAEVENSVIILSSKPPTVSPVKRSSLPPSSKAASSLPPSSSAVLSAEWANIFRKPVKQTSAEVVEVSSAATEDETAMDASPKPQRRKRGLGYSPLRHRRSRSSSPRSRPGSPGSHSPLRHSSPLRVSSPRRKATASQSPLRASTFSARHLQFGKRESKKTAHLQFFDCAPFTGLIHVQQQEKDGGFWNLPTPRTVCVLRGSDSPGVNIAHIPGGFPTSSGHGLLGLCDFNELLSTSTHRETGATEENYVSEVVIHPVTFELPFHCLT